MKQAKLIITTLVLATVALTGCTRSENRTLAGAGIGAAAGAGISAITGGDVGTGAIVGGAVGAAGALTK